MSLWSGKTNVVDAKPLDDLPEVTMDVRCVDCPVDVKTTGQCRVDLAIAG
jgi:hypothetical protein